MIALGFIFGVLVTGAVNAHVVKNLRHRVDLLTKEVKIERHTREFWRRQEAKSRAALTRNLQAKVSV